MIKVVIDTDEDINPYTGNKIKDVPQPNNITQNTFEGHAGRPGMIGGSLPRDTSKDDRLLQTPGAYISYNVAGVDDSFVISADDGYVKGYIKNADFPNERSDPKRGEIFFIETTNKRAGVGTSLMLDAMRVMKDQGIERVNISSVSDSGRGLVASLQRKEYITFIRKSSSGKAEFIINDKVIQDVTQNTFEGHAGRPGMIGGSQPRQGNDGVVSFLDEKIKSAEKMNARFPGIQDDWIVKLKNAKDTYKQYVETYGEDYPIVLIHDQPEVKARPWYGAVIAPSSKHPGEWQATYFDEIGFSSDFQSKTKAEAYWEIFSSGVTRPDPQLLETASDTDLFNAGVEFSLLSPEDRQKTSIREIMESRKNKNNSG